MLQIRVAITLLRVAVGGIEGIKAMLFLPSVRHAIAIAIGVFCGFADAELRPSADFFLAVDTSMRAILYTVDNAFVSSIASALARTSR